MFVILSSMIGHI